MKTIIPVLSLIFSFAALADDCRLKTPLRFDSSKTQSFERVRVDHLPIDDTVRDYKNGSLYLQLAAIYTQPSSSSPISEHEYLGARLSRSENGIGLGIGGIYGGDFGVEGSIQQIGNKIVHRASDKSFRYEGFQAPSTTIRIENGMITAIELNLREEDFVDGSVRPALRTKRVCVLEASPIQSSSN